MIVTSTTASPQAQVMLKALQTAVTNTLEKNVSLANTL